MRELIPKKRTVLPLTATHTLLVDGNYLMKRSYDATEKDGKYHTRNGGHIGGIFAFMMSMRKLMTTTNCTKCIICWDGENGGKLRYNIYPEYKANRPGKQWHDKTILTDKQIAEMERTKKFMLPQRIRVQQYCDELFIRQIEIDEMEADDLIAYYCKEYHLEEKITIFTNDRDMCQLLSYQNVNIMLANLQKQGESGLSINKNNYFMYFEHHYENACLIKTVCGDNSDNIKGIKGVKEKTLLKHFPEIKERIMDYTELLQRAEQLKDERKADKKKGDLQAIEYMLEGRTTIKKHGKIIDQVLGHGFYVINKQLTDLSQPMLTASAIQELRENAELPIKSDGRGSKNLIQMMNEDKFLNVYVYGGFADFVKPFYTVILTEKELEKVSNND
jgi:5'-3' exonuclease